MKNVYKKDGSSKGTVIRENDKQKVNLRDHQGLYFQIGLIVVMGLVLFALEFRTSVPVPVELPVMDVAISDFMDNPPVVRVEQKHPEPIKKTPVSETLPPEVIPNDKDITKIPEIFKPKTEEITEGLTADDIAPAAETEEIEEYNIENVEFVPVYPGCEGLTTNAERKACLQEHLKALITKNFDTDAVQSYATPGINRISVQFTVDQKGKVIDIRARAANPKLEQEAMRVLNKVPQMRAGSKGGKKVKVIYAQPILFKMEQ